MVVAFSFPSTFGRYLPTLCGPLLPTLCGPLLPTQTMAYNINKLHAKIQQNRTGMQLFEKDTA